MQNLAPAGSAAPHFAHTGVSSDPHSMQNLAPVGRAAPHFPQILSVISATSFCLMAVFCSSFSEASVFSALAANAAGL